MEENTARATTPEEFEKRITESLESRKQLVEMLKFRNRLAKAAMPELIRITSDKGPQTFWDSFKLLMRRFGIRTIVRFHINCDPDLVAKQAYIFADAMLNQMKKDYNKTSGDGKN